MTYQSLAARKVGAEVYTEAWSGIGMWRGADGSTNAQMWQRYLRTLPTDAASPWQFSGWWKPQAVVVQLGDGDFAKGDPGQPFVAGYTVFVANLRTYYPAPVYTSS